MTHKQSRTQANTFTKSSIVIGIIALALVAVAGFSYYTGGTKTGKNIPGVGYSCPMAKTTSSNKISGGCSMMGNTKTVQTFWQNVSTTNPTAQVITMNYNESGLTPTTVKVKIGQKYKIIINANTSVYGCMNAITLPGLDDNLQQITKGSKIVFNIAPTKAGTYEFLCAMGVPHGAIVIVQ